MAVTHFQVLRRRPYEGGQQFGDAGSYERIDALVRFAVDPRDPLNGGIADLECAPRSAAGKVNFDVDLVLLRPVEPARGNGGLYTSVVNRGRTAVLPFSFPPPGFVPAFNDHIEPGDGFLLRHGWTVALCGWQWDVVRRPGALGLDAPLALNDDGTPAETIVTVRFQPLTARASEYLGHWPAHPNYNEDRVHHAYPAANLDDPEAVLTARDRPGDSPEALPRGSWRFARCMEDGGEVQDATWVTLDGGFQPGRIYELRYRTARCPVAGLGLLAIRDASSFLKYGTAEAGNPVAGGVDRAVVHGVSQTGRFLREFLHTGCNMDEASRQVFDGIFVQIAGARRGEFNFRGAQPSAQYGGNGQAPPFAYTATSACAEGLIDAQRVRGGVPKIFEVNTANEYWRSDAMLVHSDPAGGDLEIPDDVRVYMMAGCQHGPGIPFLSDRSPLMPEQHTGNNLSILNYTPLTRAALVNLDAWVRGEAAPPPNTVPSTAECTAASRDSVLDQLAAVPGIAMPDRSLLSTTLVPAVDTDGNDVPGIHLPELRVPLATSTGWNPRHEETGAPGQLADMAGTTAAFAPNAEERALSGDPRRSLDERYAGQEAYCEQVRTAAQDLAAERFMLAEDIDRVVASAGRLYERIRGS